MFHFQLNGEALWRLREVCGLPSTVFQLLQSSILPLGYRLTESAGERVGSALAESIRWFWKKNQNVKIMTKCKQMRAVDGFQSFSNKMSGHRLIKGLCLSSLLCERNK